MKQTIAQKIKRSVTSIGLGCSALLGSVFLSGCNIREVPYTAKVVEKVYTPSSSSTGVGYGQSFGRSSGGVVVTSNHTAERYTLIVVRDDNGETTSVRVDAATWANAEKGEKVNLTETLFF